VIYSGLTNLFMGVKEKCVRRYRPRTLRRYRYAGYLSIFIGHSLQSCPNRLKFLKSYPPSNSMIGVNWGHPQRSPCSPNSLALPISTWMNQNLTPKYVCSPRPFTMKLTSEKLWMGTHPKSPSLIPVSLETLASYLARNQFLIGETVSHKFGTEGNLPFLFKVLAIEKALSIQSHPDKATAEKLHAQQPDIYKGKSRPIAWSA
jgi:Phosphomannose isomerase type I